MLTDWKLKKLSMWEKQITTHTIIKENRLRPERSHLILSGALLPYGYTPVLFAGIYSMAQRKRTVQQAFLVKFATQTEKVLCGLFPQRTF